MRTAKKRIILALKLLVAGGFIFWLLKSGKVDWSQLEGLGSGWPWLVAAVVPYGLVLGLCAYRWQRLLGAQGVNYPLGEAGALTLVGHFFNQFLLGTTGGDVIKAYAIASESPGRRGAAAMSVFFDRAVGLLVLVAVALVAIPFNLDLIASHPHLRFLAGMVGAVFAASLVGGYVFYSEKIRNLAPVQWILRRLPLQDAIAKLTRAVYVYKFHPGIVLASVGASVLVHGLVVLMHLFLTLAVGGQPSSWGSFFFLIPIAQIAMAIPINPPGALGTGEAIYSALLPLVGVSSTHAIMICLLQRVVYYAWAVAGCVCYLRRKGRVEAAVHAAEEDEEREERNAAADSDRVNGPDVSPADRDREVRPRVDSGAL